MNCNHPVVQEFIVQCLRYWVEEYRVDGFRFDLASILGRDQDGAPMEKPPLIQRLAYDPILGNVKLIAEAWDAGGMYQVGNFPAWKRWAEWNGKYRDDIRSYLKGDIWSAPEAVKRITGSMDLYGGSYLGYDSSVNFITCHDGFTLYDLYAYNNKHNEDNGWNNTDGANDNRSWNCGVEGETKDKEIKALRTRQVKNAAAILLLSRGIPMLLAGDEFRNTQSGNNNSYCQDSEISWIDWKDLKKNKDTFEFFKKMIAFRGKHPILKRNDFFTGHNSTGYPDLSFHGTRAWDFDDSNEFLSFAFMYAESAKDYPVEEDSFIYCAVNAHWETKVFELPIIPEGMHWEIVAYTADEKGKSDGREVSGAIDLMARSVMVLIAR